MRTNRQAFTLIELLVVISIVAMLGGMLAPVMQFASKQARKTNTQSLLATVDAGLRRFKQDIGVYPYQAHDTGSPGYASTGNNLAFHLTRGMSSAEFSALKADTLAAKRAYAPDGAHRITKDSPELSSSNKGGAAQVFNRMGKERASLMIYAGHGDIDGVASKDGLPLLSAGASSKGWGDEYLSGDIAERNIDGDAIVDDFGQPLLYVCPVICGIQGSPVPHNIDTRWYPRIHLIRTDHWGFQPEGRTLAGGMNSDIRSTAGAEYLLEFELWSFGEDGRGDPLREHSSNKDNIPSMPYLEGLE